MTRFAMQTGIANHGAAIAKKFVEAGRALVAAPMALQNPASAELQLPPETTAPQHLGFVPRRPQGRGAKRRLAIEFIGAMLQLAAADDLQTLVQQRHFHLQPQRNTAPAAFEQPTLEAQ